MGTRVAGRRAETKVPPAPGRRSGRSRAPHARRGGRREGDGWWAGRPGSGDCGSRRPGLRRVPWTCPRPGCDPAPGSVVKTSGSSRAIRVSSRSGLTSTHVRNSRASSTSSDSLPSLYRPVWKKNFKTLKWQAVFSYEQIPYLRHIPSGIYLAITI